MATAYELVNGVWSGRQMQVPGDATPSGWVRTAPPTLSGGQYALYDNGAWIVRTGTYSAAVDTPDFATAIQGVSALRRTGLYGPVKAVAGSGGGSGGGPASIAAPNDGIGSAVSAISTAQAAAGKLYLPAGTYLIDSNLTITADLVCDGIFSISSGVTLTFAGHLDAGNYQIFSGAGTVKKNDGYHNLVWYAGNSANTKWDFLKRGFLDSEPKTVYVPPAKKGTAWTATIAGNWYGYKIDAPLIIDAQHNILTWINDGAWFVASTAVTAMVQIGPTEKPEYVNFPRGLWLHGGNTAQCCLHVDNASRLSITNKLYALYCTSDAVRFQTGVNMIDKVTIDWMECTGYGGIGFLLDGGTRAVLNVDVGVIFTNGCKSGGTHLVKMVGPTRVIHFGSVQEETSIPGGLFDVETAIVGIYATTNGTSENDIVFGSLFGSITNKPMIIGQGNSTRTVSFTVTNSCKKFSYTTQNVILDYVINTNLNGVMGGTPPRISISDTCSNITINGLYDTNSFGAPKIDNLIVNGKMYAYPTMATDTAVSFENQKLNALITISDYDAAAYSAVFILQESGGIVPVYTAASVTFQTGVLTGTTGPTGKINISFSGSRLYVENRAGSTRSIKLSS